MSENELSNSQEIKAERRQIKDKPIIALDNPEITKDTIRGFMRIDIFDAVESNKETEDLRRRRQRIENLLREVGETKNEVELRQKTLNLLEDKVKLSKQNGDKLYAAEFDGDKYYLSSLYNKLDSWRDHSVGLYNRRGFIEMMSLMVNKTRALYGKDAAEIIKGKSVTILMTDIDNFGEFNKKYNHNKGDEVLSVVAESMRNGVRNTDIVSRWGGEENVVTAVGGADPWVIDARMVEQLSGFGLINVNQEENISEEERIKQTGLLRARVSGLDEGETVTFSAGAVEVSWEVLEEIFSEGTVAEKEDRFKQKILAIADKKLRQAKAAGKDNIKVEGTD